jgi:cytosine/adenosine deaminase-related metal-dependent hydrolase
MATRFDVLLKNGWAVDPTTGLDSVVDVGVAGGRIAEIAPDLDPDRAAEVFDVAGAHVVPGIIDLHMHASEWLGGRWGHKMMARVGVTTALDMSGPVGSVMRMLRDHGTGLNIACIEAVRPGLTVRDSNPDRAELEGLLRTALSGGAIGIKLLGGHYPLTPEATARAIATANTQRAYVAFHAGTTERGSNIDGFLQAADLAAGNAVHIAHINSYCRGAVRPHMQETEEAIAALVAHPNLRSENYLSPLNGTSAKCANGTSESRVTQQCLKVGGFPPTEAGFEAAILAGWAEINVEAGGEVILATGKSAVEFWRGRGTDTTVSFRVNPPEPRLRLATAKRPDGEFVVDCVSTDGGGIPRNVIVEMGLALVSLQALTLSEFVRKTSTNPARILGLTNKGRLAVGSDADITVLDLAARKAILSLASGAVIMVRGYVCGRGGRMITTAAGREAVEAAGLAPIVVDVGKGGFYRS